MDETGKRPETSVIVYSRVFMSGRARMVTDKEMSPVGTEKVELVGIQETGIFFCFRQYAIIEGNNKQQIQALEDSHNEGGSFPEDCG